jgi:hypothetical protein
LFESDFSKATVITMFLLPDINLKLRPKILDLRAGTRIVSNSFDMGEWKPDETARVTQNCTSYCTAYFWIVPAKVAGTWKLAQGEIMLKQTFQRVSGTLENGNATTPIANGRLSGDRITFTAGRARYVGRVSGNSMEGSVTSGANKSKWHATRARDQR